MANQTETKKRGRRALPKRTRARNILMRVLEKEGALPNRQAGIKLLLRRIDLTDAQASNYYNHIRKEVAAA